MKSKVLIKQSGLSALSAWLGSFMIVQACHTDEDLIGEPNWIVAGSFNRLLPVPPVSPGDVSPNAQ